MKSLFYGTAIQHVLKCGLAIATLLLVFSHFPVSGDNQISKDDEQKYTTVALKAIQREETYLRENGCWTVTNAPSKFYFKKNFDDRRQQDIITLESTNPIFRIQLLPVSAQVVNFANWTSLHASNKYYPEPPKLKWTQEKVVSLAMGYAKAVLGDQMPYNLKLSIVQATPQRDGIRYMDSDWRVIWARTDKKGYKFKSDSLVVQLVDGHGPTDLGYNFWSHYDDKTITPIAQDKALILAAEGAKEILAWAPGAMWLKNYELAGTPTMDLRVVTPNHLTAQPSIESLGRNTDLNARLAWVATYPKTYTGPSSPGQMKPTGGSLQVWIDAENGQLLGGDFK